MYNIIHFRKKCIGCFNCEEVSPDFWKISNSDGKSILLDSKNKNGVFVKTITDSDNYGFEANLEASKNCPVNIIKVINLS